MLNLYGQLLKYSVLAFGSSFLVAAICLMAINRSSEKFLPFLYVKSPKSPTGAKLLGGLAISLGNITGSLFLLTGEHLLPSEECSLIISFVISSVIITVAGYIDDKFEIRARHKLLLQLLSVSFLTFQAAHFLGEKNLVIAYVIITFIGFLLVNGTNLLDGLDTLSIKTSIVTSIAFTCLGFLSYSPLTILLSMTTISSLGAFYFYNRPPAKIYLGEIGGSLLGLIFTAQTILCYQHLRTTQVAISAMSLILIATILPISELGISFLRRIYFKKSPFKGDKLHLHYIVKTKMKASVNSTTNLLAIGNITLITTGLSLAYFTSPLFAMIVMNIIYCLVYVLFCYSEWAKGQNNSALENVFSGIQRKSVYFVNSSDLDRINFKLANEELKNKEKSTFEKYVA